jgi:periodic tryptophan protein 2
LEGEDVTPESTRDCIKHKEYSRALLMALQLGDMLTDSHENNLLTEVIEAVPTETIPLVVRSVTGGSVCRLIEALAPRLLASRHLEFYLAFSLEVLSAHGALLKPQSITARASMGTTMVTTQRLRAALRSLQKAILRQQQVLLTLCDENHFTLKFLDQSQSVSDPRAAEEEIE